MSEQKHTPTPWIAAQYGPKTWGLGSAPSKGIPSGAVFKVQCVNDDVKSPAAIADMQFILTACNSHDALVDALELLYNETADYIRLNNLGNTHHNESMKRARAALSLARGGGK